MGRFLEFFRPIAPFIPEVKTPERKVSFNRKLMWTGFALICYLIMAETPLYGVNIDPSQAQQLAAYRVIFASTAGTLLELGIGPIVTAGLIIQLLAGSDLIGFDNTNPEDRALFTTVSKIFSFLMIAFQSLSYIITGQYGQLTLSTAAIIFSQLFLAGFVLMMLDEMVQKGWGIGSGISLFIVAGITKTIWMSSFNFYPSADGRRIGAIWAFFEGIMDRTCDHDSGLRLRGLRGGDEGGAADIPLLLQGVQGEDAHQAPLRL
jgi:preprotein translocase subunit SecY/protein transport protein SEC61 subunit alpha